MKREGVIASIILIVFVAIAIVSSYGVSLAPKKVIPGDASGDGLVNLDDVILILQWLNNPRSVSAFSESLADYDGDGMITIEGDVYGILAYLFSSSGSGDAVLLGPSGVPAFCTDPFIRGDGNGDGSVNIVDVIYLLSYIFGEPGIADPLCLDIVDVDDDGLVDLADPVYLLDYLFASGPVIPEPFPNAGYDELGYGGSECNLIDDDGDGEIDEGEECGFPEFLDYRDFHGQDWTTPGRMQACCELGGVYDCSSPPGYSLYDLMQECAASGGTYHICGSCAWFGMLGAVETYANLYYNDPTLDFDMAEQDLLSCSPGATCQGAPPSVVSDGLEHLKNTGIVDETCFPYVAADSTPLGGSVLCSDVCPNPDARYKITDYKEVYPQNHDELRSLIYRYGPVSTAFGYGPWPDSYQAFWNHAMPIVGYGTVQEGDWVWAGPHPYAEVQVISGGLYEDFIGKPYYIIKNSFDEDFGDGNGFGKIIGYFMGETPAPGLSGPLFVFYDFINSAAYYEGPVTNDFETYEVLCTDADSDGYCFWGISEEMPPSCAILSCQPTPDCDDSNGAVTTYDGNYNCV